MKNNLKNLMHKLENHITIALDPKVISEAMEFEGKEYNTVGCGNCGIGIYEMFVGHQEIMCRCFNCNYIIPVKDMEFSYTDEDENE